MINQFLNDLKNDDPEWLRTVMDGSVMREYLRNLDDPQNILFVQLNTVKAMGFIPKILSTRMEFHLTKADGIRSGPVSSVY